MRVVNRIVNILVLVFAIAAVVFSYLLFNKREKLVSGWEQMAQTINQTAKNLDAKSGTKLAVELSSEKLNHKQFNKTDLSELEKALPKLPEGAKKIIAQRDALAEALNQVGKYAEINDVKTADLEKLDTSAAKQQQIVSGAKRTADRNAGIFNDYVRISGSAGANTSVGELKKNPAYTAAGVDGFYRLVSVQPFDMFPQTKWVETLVLLSHKEPDSHISVNIEFGEGEGQLSLKEVEKRAEARKSKEKVTYKMIQQYIEENYGFKVHTAYIAEVKRNLGLSMYDAPNAVEELKRPRSHPTEKMVLAIKETLAHFEII